MIVGSVFVGDEWEELKWAQHDVYDDSIQSILGATRRWSVKNDCAKELAGFRRGLSSIDHRDLQNFHDHLAAYWRQRNDYGAARKTPSAFYAAQQWRQWLLSRLSNAVDLEPDFMMAIAKVFYGSDDIAQWVSLSWTPVLMSGNEFKAERDRRNCELDKAIRELSKITASLFPIRNRLLEK